MLTKIRNPKSKTNPNAGISLSLNELMQLRYVSNHIDLKSLIKTRTILSGDQLSHLRGRGIDFAEVRHYQAGDDIRHIDWRVTARSGKAHTKIFQEERERPVFFVVDYGASMFFGTRHCYKSVVAATAASMLAWAASQQGDRIGGIVFSDQHFHEIKPTAGTKGVIALLKLLADKNYPDSDNLNEDSLTTALGRLRRIARPGSLIFILSDFINLNNDSEKHLSQLVKHNDVVAGFIYDPLEKNPPPPNYYSITNGQEIIQLNTHDQSLCQQYHHHFDQRVEKLTMLCREQQMPLIMLSTDQDSVTRLSSESRYLFRGKKR